MPCIIVDGMLGGAADVVIGFLGDSQAMITQIKLCQLLREV